MSVPPTAPSRTATLWYAGPAVLELRALVATLVAEGLEVVWDPPARQRFGGEVEPGVTLAILVTGHPTVIRSALASWRGRFGQTASVEGIADDGEDLAAD